MPKTMFTDAYASVLQVLIDARRDAGLTQAELARRVGRTQPVISVIERGARRIDVVEFYVLAKAIGAEPSDLFRLATKDMKVALRL